MASETEWVSIKAAAEWLGVSPDTVRRRLKRGELPGRHERTAQGFVWQIEVPHAPARGQRVSSEQPAPAIAADALELARLRERVSGLERERGELIAQRDAWQEQARRSSEAEAQLRELVARAQILAQALPASTGDGRGHAEGAAADWTPSGSRATPGRWDWWDRIRRRSSI